MVNNNHRFCKSGKLKERSWRKPLPFRDASSSPKLDRLFPTSRLAKRGSYRGPPEPEPEPGTCGARRALSLRPPARPPAIGLPPLPASFESLRRAGGSGAAALGRRGREGTGRAGSGAAGPEQEAAGNPRAVRGRRPFFTREFSLMRAAGGFS